MGFKLVDVGPRLEIRMVVGSPNETVYCFSKTKSGRQKAWYKLARLMLHYEEEKATIESYPKAIRYVKNGKS